MQDAESHLAFPPTYPQIAAMREMFVYRTKADFASWQRSGRTEDNRDRMIHLLFTQAGVTLVSDGDASESFSIVAEMTEELVRLGILGRDDSPLPPG